MRYESFLMWFGVAALIYIVLYIIGNHNWNKSSQDEASEQNNLKYVKDKGGTLYYGEEARYIDGKQISTHSDLTEWNVLKYFSTAIADHLMDIKREAEDGKCENYGTALKNWDLYYERLRALCIQHKLWNPLMNDHEVFVPTPSQLNAESELRANFLESCELGIDKAYTFDCMKEQIFNYLLLQPRHEAVRRKMVNDLAGSEPENKKRYRKTCAEMVADGILSEKHNDAGDLIVKKKRLTKKKNECLDLEPSTFSEEMYANIDHLMLCKVKHTVGKPENVDRIGNRCVFHSLSTGTMYRTSLSQCTCEAFKGGNAPCKHMVALAQYLFYI